jgi:hypothetical protein
MSKASTLIRRRGRLEAERGIGGQREAGREREREPTEPAGTRGGHPGLSG